MFANKAYYIAVKCIDFDSAIGTPLKQEWIFSVTSSDFGIPAFLFSNRTVGPIWQQLGLLDSFHKN